MSVVGDRLKLLRKINNKAQAEIGEVIGVGATAISNYENDNTMPSTPNIVRLAKYFGVDVAYIIGQKNLMHEPGSGYTVLQKIPLVDKHTALNLPEYIATVASEYITATVEGANTNTFAVKLIALGTPVLVIAERGNTDTNIVLCEVDGELAACRRSVAKSKNMRAIGGILSFE